MARTTIIRTLNVPGINTLDVYCQKGGYRAVEKALKTLTPDEIVEEVKKSGLQGSRRSWISNWNEMELSGET